MKAILLLIGATMLVAPLQAQSPKPIVVQAVSPQAAAPSAAAAPVSPGSSEATLKLLLEMKAANDAVLAKQAATLQVLDDLEKAAEQIKVYSKRG